MAGDKSWEGQSFTLVIFVGVVVLCSVFFVLGMLAGRSQSTGVADSDEITIESGEVLGEESEEFDFNFFESVAETELPGLETRPGSELPESTPSPAEADPPTVVDPDSPDPTVEPAADVLSPDEAEAEADADIILQVVALLNADQAQSLREELVRMGFPAFVLLPGPDDPSPLNRVQVGPFSDAAEVRRVLQALEDEGHTPMVVP